METEPNVSNTSSRLILAKVMFASLFRPYSSAKAFMVFMGSEEIIKIEVFSKKEIDFLISVASYWQCSHVVLNNITTVAVRICSSYFELSIATIGSDLSEVIFTFASSAVSNLSTVIVVIHETNKKNEIAKAQSNILLMLGTETYCKESDKDYPDK
jgi:hypothetical protein